MSLEATSEKPIYRKVHQEHGATDWYFIVCDEGWRQSIVCCDMYEYVADWLLGVLGQTPFAKDPVSARVEDPRAD